MLLERGEIKLTCIFSQHSQSTGYFNVYNPVNVSYYQHIIL